MKKIGTVKLLRLVEQFELLDGIDTRYEYMSMIGNEIANAYNALSKWQLKKLGEENCNKVEGVIMTTKTIYNALKFEAVP